MPWSESQRSRLALERTILEQYFRDDVEWIEPRGETKVELKLRSNNETAYKLRVYLQNDFPNSCPHMAVVFPVQLKKKNGKSLPLLDHHFHTLGLTVDGFTKLCHYSPELWTADNTLFQVFMKGRLWIEAYEGHLETGNTMDVYLRRQSQTPGPGDEEVTPEPVSSEEKARGNLEFPACHMIKEINIPVLRGGYIEVYIAYCSQKMGQKMSFEDTYIHEDKLGEGAFGEVFKVRHRGTGKRYALKVIKCSNDEELTNVMDEMKALSKLRHMNIIRLFETKHKQNEEFSAEIALLFEYCSKGTLSARLLRSSSKQEQLQWMHQLADAVTYIHSRKLVHRDLKPDNILLTRSEDIKVGDFGLSREFVAVKRDDQTWESYYMLYGCGTVLYMAPEVFDGHYTEKADVFSLGVLFYAIEERSYREVNKIKYFGAFIQDDDGEMIPLGIQMYIEQSESSVTFDKTDSRLANIIRLAFVFDQKKRTSAAKLQEKLNEYISV